MLAEGHLRIYWANAMFSEADRDFNSKSAMRLREAGYQVFLPQETGVNQKASPSAQDIFRAGTSMIIGSDLLVACIDQEAIDCGVACEIGLAFAYGVPAIGLYTDIRQYRKGESRMYKNPYVVGAIEATGQIVTSVDELLEVLRKSPSSWLDSFGGPMSQEQLSQHFDRVALHYREFAQDLESWYEPSWTAAGPAMQWLDIVKPCRILDFGCGLGSVGACILRAHARASYVGYDQSQAMVQHALASTSLDEDRSIFTSSWAQVQEYAEKEAFDVALMSFVLHDLADPSDAARAAADCLRPSGVLLIIDLSTLDLPRLTELLRAKLARPHRVKDRRLDPAKLTALAESSGLMVAECSMALPRVHFPSPDAVERYLEMFGIYLGMDLPLALTGTDHTITRRLVQQTLREQAYPFSDQRAFLICALRREG